MSTHPKTHPNIRPQTHDLPNDTRSAGVGPFSPAALPPIRSERAATVARWFGLSDRAARGAGATDARSAGAGSIAAAAMRFPLPPPGTITLITGPSGAGKSSLLRALCRSRRRRWIDVAAIDLPALPLVDVFGDVPLTEVLRLLSRVGLAEAWTYLRTPAELSDGQRWRARLALAMHRAAAFQSPAPAPAPLSAPLPALPPAPARPPVLVADEFAAVLDRVTASIVARALRRAIIATPNLSAIVATSHDDLVRALRPDTIIRCDFDRRRVEKPALR